MTTFTSTTNESRFHTRFDVPEEYLWTFGDIQFNPQICHELETSCKWKSLYESLDYEDVEKHEMTPDGMGLKDELHYFDSYNEVKDTPFEVQIITCVVLGLKPDTFVVGQRMVNATHPYYGKSRKYTAIPAPVKK